MKSDIEIARSVAMDRIEKVAERAGIDAECLDHYGKYIAKLPLSIVDEAKVKKSRLILVTAITATKAGIGKTTVSVGLALGLNRIGKRVSVALREPSLGPCFGVKGGAAGGGYAQVVPMEKINLHFTGDFHAITSAHNMISALLDNYLYQHEAEGFGLKTVVWRRVLDVNDRALRDVVIGLGPRTNGVTRQTGFDITAASELMAIVCLASDLADLERRIGNILLGFTYDDKPFTVKDMGVEGAITVLLKAAMSCSDYVVTEAGFSADLGAEKFYDIKCRKSGLQPSLTILVATVQGLKVQGGVDYSVVKEENVAAVEAGFENLDKHLRNIRKFGQTVIVAINRFPSDTDAEVAAIETHCRRLGVGFAVNRAFSEGGAGAEELARLVVDTIEREPSAPLRFAYADSDSIEEKVVKVATEIYGATSVVFSASARRMMQTLERNGMGHFPVCIAKTQYSFSTDPKRMGAADGFELQVNDVIVNSGAEMIVVVAGDILRMPGLPKKPMALNIRIKDGLIEGLS